MNIEQELALIKSWTPHFSIKEEYGEFVTHCPARGYMVMTDWSLTYDQAIGGAYTLVKNRIWRICCMIEEEIKK